MSKADDLIGFASAELGKPYVFGEEGPDAFDCSGLMQFVFGKIGISLPRIAAQQQQATRKVSTPMPGDLAFWGSPAHHVALYVGDGKVISAPSAGENVRLQSVWGQPEYRRVSGLGALTAPIVDLGAAGAGAVGGLLGATVGDWLGGARAIVVEGAVVMLGVGLLAAGLWRATSPARDRRMNAAKKIIGG